jgi:NAD-dependent deacetylase
VSARRELDEAEIIRVAAAVNSARRVVFFTGAGISAESGLPTYRGIGGLYNDITVDEGLPIEEALSGAMFARSPEITWKYIAEIERACRGAGANAAHRAIAALEAVVEVCIVTQNVDGLHTVAGSSNVIELHGNLGKLACTSCDDRTMVEDYSGIEIPPRCSLCDGVLRPMVVLFGEMLPEAAIQRYDAELARGFDVFFSIGTTAGFPYIFEPIAEASRCGMTTVEINPDFTPLSRLVSHRFDNGARVTLETIAKRVQLG